MNGSRQKTRCQPTRMSSERGEASLVGNAGVKLRLDKSSGTWSDQQSEPPFNTDFHGTWVSPTGTALTLPSFAIAYERPK